MEVLLVEDEDPKLNALLSFLSKNYGTFLVKTARSAKAAIERLREQVPDLILLDMSLPTFDIVEGEPGGRPQGFGGIEVMRHIEMMEINVPVLIVTGYEGFTKEGKNIDVIALGAELRSEFPEIFHGIVQFNSISGEWIAQLRRLMEEVIRRSSS